MHLNKILEQIKRHQSPTEAIDKLATALEKHEGSLLEKGFTILKSELAANMYEAINGPHFDEEHARYAVEGMENEDGTKGPHWTVEETTSVANQMGINLKVVTVVGGGSSSSCSSGCGADGVEMASVVETKQKQIRISLV